LKKLINKLIFKEMSQYSWSKRY